MMRDDKFRDPVHGFIIVRPWERKIIDSKPFQRLRNIKQLALTNYVYHGAEHTRFGHSIGVMYLADRAFKSAVSKDRYTFDEDPIENEKRIKWLEQILRLIALTHDLGHAPFSHAAEDLFPPKTQSADGKIKYYKHEDLTEKIVKETEIADIINSIGTEFKAKYGEQYDITPDIICDVYSGKNAGVRSEFTFLKTFMDSELDCDKMDYLLRDSLYCGVTYGRYDVDRLISCLTIFKKEGEEAPFLGIEAGGVPAFEGFVLARYFMFVQVYFHRTRRYFDLVLSEALKICLPDNVFPIDVQEYLKWDDSRVIQLLYDKAESVEKAKDTVTRKHWKCIYYTKIHPQDDGITLFKGVQKTLKRKFGAKIFEQKFLVDTSANKLPHKIVPRKHAIDDEEVIAIVDIQNNKVSTISDESHIINNLTEKIHIMRIYAADDLVQEALAEVRALVGNEEEGDEGNV